MDDIEAKSPTREEHTAEPSPAEANGHTEVEHHAASEHSPWPILLSLGILIVAVGLLSQLAIVAVGLALCVGAVIGWLWQPWVS